MVVKCSVCKKEDAHVLDKSIHICAPCYLKKYKVRQKVRRIYDKPNKIKTPARL